MGGGGWGVGRCEPRIEGIKRAYKYFTIYKFKIKKWRKKIECPRQDLNPRFSGYIMHYYPVQYETFDRADRPRPIFRARNLFF